jgi:hypothetical protein
VLFTKLLNATIGYTNPKTVIAPRRPDSAICHIVTLSHTWDVTDQEITLQDLQEIHKHPPGLSPHPFTFKSGYQKIVRCCTQALRDGFDWAWIDTCCIDKTSSVELSEAINSMFQWYRDCQVCYTFLYDVSDGDILGHEDSEFRRSRWFTRGWTVQELLAPHNLRFFSKSWNELGNRYHLRDLVSQLTGIPTIYLVGDGPVSDLPHSSISLQNRRTHRFFEASVAQRMSWASRRSTTRKEDLSYCLLGIFNVNIPLLYGEGDKAFRRLQEEIMKRTNDQSLFAWGYSRSQPAAMETDSIGHGPYSYLATSPTDFEGCHDMISRKNGRRKSFEVTKKGLCIDIDLLIFKDKPTSSQNRRNRRTEAFGLLDCHPAGDLFNRIAIPLGELRKEGENISVKRKHGSPLLWPEHLSHRARFETVYIIDSQPDSTKPSKAERRLRSANSDGSVIIPPVPFLSVELLTADPTLAITRPDGLAHLMIQEIDASAPTLASGRAYFRFQPTNINTPSAHPDSLVMIAFQLSPPDDIEVPLDITRNETIHDGLQLDHVSLEPPYPPGPNKLRKKRKRIGNGWTYTRSCRSSTGTRLKGKVHCFIIKTPTVSGELLKTPEYLKALPWTDSSRLGHADQKFRLRIQEVEVMGSKRGVLTLTRILDSQFEDSWLLNWGMLGGTSFGLMELQLGRMICLALLGYLSILGSSLCLVHGNWFAGSLWTVLGVACMALCISRRRHDHELPPWLLFISLTFCGLLAFFISIFRISGLYSLIPLLLLSVLFVLFQPALMKAERLLSVFFV